jgi:hypothetical protein
LPVQSSQHSNHFTPLQQAQSEQHENFHELVWAQLSPGTTTDQSLLLQATSITYIRYNIWVLPIPSEFVMSWGWKTAFRKLGCGCRGLFFEWMAISWPILDGLQEVAFGLNAD